MNIDQGILRRLYYENSRKYHPDFYTLEPEKQQEEALRQSTLNNEAYKILKDGEKRLRHLLEVKGAIKDGDKEILSQVFLMEMMDVNEAIMDVQQGDTSQKRLTDLNNEINTLTDKLNAEINEMGKTKLNESDIKSLKNCYFKLKYIKRLKGNISKL